MTIPEGQEVGGRLQRALEAFQKAQGLLLTAHRRLKELSAAEVERFWARHTPEPRSPGIRPVPRHHG